MGKVSFKYGTASQLANAPYLEGTFYVISDNNSTDGILYADLNSKRICFGDVASLVEDISDLESSIPTKVSELTNDSGFVKRFVVTITENGLETESYSADKTFSEIVTAYQNGYEIVCHCMMDNSFIPFLALSDNLIQFELSGMTSYGVPMAEYVDITSTNNITHQFISFTETDPIFSASAAANISSTDISNWNSKTSNTGTVTSIGLTNATNGGLTISGTPITNSGSITVGHSNVLSSAQITQAVYPIKIDKNGHVSAYGSAVSIPTKVSDLTNDSGYLTLATLPVYNGTVV